MLVEQVNIKRSKIERNKSPKKALETKKLINEANE
jgi:hypothetical protein